MNPNEESKAFLDRQSKASLSKQVQTTDGRTRDTTSRECGGTRARIDFFLHEDDIERRKIDLNFAQTNFLGESMPHWAELFFSHSHSTPFPFLHYSRIIQSFYFHLLTLSLSSFPFLNFEKWRSLTYKIKLHPSTYIYFDLHTTHMVGLVYDIYMLHIFLPFS